MEAMELLNENDTFFCDVVHDYAENCTLDYLRNIPEFHHPNCTDEVELFMEEHCSMGGLCVAPDGIVLDRGITVVLVLVLSLIGNFCTVFLLSKFKVHKVPDVLVVGLALNDLLTTFLPIPMATYSYFAAKNFAEGCILCKLFGTLAVFTRLSSSQIVTLVAIERYLAVNRPFIYRSHVTPKKFVIVLLLSWLLAAVLSVIPLVDGYRTDSYTGFCLFDITGAYALAIVIYSLAEFVIVFVCFLLVTIELVKVYRRRKRLKVQDKYNSNSRANQRVRSLSFTKPNFTSRISDLGKSIKKAAPIITEKLHLSVEAQFARMLFAVVALFYISWTLLVTIILVGVIRGTNEGLQDALFWAIRLAVLSTALNPLLYGILARQYRLAYYYVIRLWFSKCCYCVSPPLKDVFAAARTVGGDPKEARRDSQSRHSHSTANHSYSASVFGPRNVRLTNATNLNITLPPTLDKIQEELSLEPEESSIAAEFSTHIPSAGELSSSVTIPYQARDHNDSSTVDLQIRGAASMDDLVDSGMVELGLSRDHQDGINNPLACMMTKVVGGQEVLISPGTSEDSENVEESNPLFSNPVYDLANGGTNKTTEEIALALSHRQNMLAASSTDDITLISKKKKKVTKTRSSDVPYQGLESPQHGASEKVETLPLPNGTSRLKKTAQKSYVPLGKAKVTRFPLEKSHKKYMRDRITATDIDSGRTIVVHSHEDLSSLGVANGTTPGGYVGGVKRESRASSFSPTHDRPISVPNSAAVQRVEVHTEAVSKPTPPAVQPKRGRSGIGGIDVKRLTEKFESPSTSRAPYRMMQSQSDSTPSQSAPSPIPGTRTPGRRNSTENSDSGRESMVLESDIAV